MWEQNGLNHNNPYYLKTNVNIYSFHREENSSFLESYSDPANFKVIGSVLIFGTFKYGAVS